MAAECGHNAIYPRCDGAVDRSVRGWPHDECQVGIGSCPQLLTLTQCGMLVWVMDMERVPVLFVIAVAFTTVHVLDVHNFWRETHFFAGTTCEYHSTRRAGLLPSQEACGGACFEAAVHQLHQRIRDVQSHTHY